MPIFRIDNRVVLFAHVPKCAGGTVEQTLVANGYPMAFYDGRFWASRGTAWYRASPQHLERAQIDRLFGDFFDYDFAVVRDPLDRFLSAFNHNRRKIGRTVSCARFVDRLERRGGPKGDYFSYRFDNHFLPAARFVGPATRVFFLEDGMAAILAALARDLGVTLASGDMQHNAKNYDVTRSESGLKSALKAALLSPSPRRDTLSEPLAARIRDLYSEDYRLFDRYASRAA